VNFMFKTKVTTGIVGLALGVGSIAQLLAQGQQEAVRQLLQQRIAEIKQSITANKASLKQYAWTETTEVTLKGEVKKREQKECHYGPDGQVQKTALGASEEPEEKGGGKGKRGIKGKIVEKKKAELKDYMDRFNSLIRRYLPPDPERMKAAFQSGKASLDQSQGGATSLVFKDYVKTGDTVNLTFDTRTKKIRSYNVRSYLDGPEDAANLWVRFNSLPDGTNYVEETLMDGTGKQIQIKVTNFDYRKSGH
jgi:hypothetical protein